MRSYDQVIKYFVVNDTAPTEIYTYCHTRALHEALPSDVATIARAVSAALEARGIDSRAANPWYFPTPEDYGAHLAAAGFAVGSIELIRSAEHTSELQSLMRISYAVFCLQKHTPLPLSLTTLSRY